MLILYFKSKLNLVSFILCTICFTSVVNIAAPTNVNFWYKMHCGKCLTANENEKAAIDVN